MSPLSCISYSAISSVNFGLWGMACRVEDTLDCAYFQTWSCVLTKELPRSTPNSSTVQCRRKIASFLDGASYHALELICVQPVCVHQEARCTGYVDLVDNALGDGARQRKQILVYCSDVAGAFDRVSRERLLAKLIAKGIHPKLVKLIGSWLEPRNASVVIGGATSEPFTIKDLVFQGTVLGLQL